VLNPFDTSTEEINGNKQADNCGQNCYQSSPKLGHGGDNDESYGGCGHVCLFVVADNFDLIPYP